MRGKAEFSVLCDLVRGITPAHAGKSRRYGRAHLRPEDHPRPCGEKQEVIATFGAPDGSPPPMRGKAIGIYI